jgi:hypothetical protein
MVDYCRAYGISYLWHNAMAGREKAKLSLELLLNRSTGIGDHSTGDFHNSLDEALDLLVDAEDRLDILATNYPELTGDPALPEAPPF